MMALVLSQEMAQLFIGAAILTLSWMIFSRRRLWSLPPGPKRLSIIGNVFQLSRGYEWLQYAHWGKEYGGRYILVSYYDFLRPDVSTGSILYLSFLGERVFVLNSQQAAVDILERNMNVYSDRPRNMIMASELYVFPDMVILVSHCLYLICPAALDGTALLLSTQVALNTASSDGS